MQPPFHRARSDLVSPSNSRAEPPALGFASRAVHAGERPPRPDFTPTATPIYPATAFVYDDTATLDAVFGNEREGYVYTRYANPTSRALETAVAALEGTADAVAFASGMGAVYAALLLDARAGQTVVAAPDVYGATYAILTKLLPTLGVQTVFADLLDLDALTVAVNEHKPALVYAETISNPLLRVADLRAVTEIAHRHRARVAVDNTFASPWLVNPAAFGVDSVIHSTTKYLGGHGDVTGGVVATTGERAAELREINKLIGAVAGPFDAWLTLRGLKTLPLRMKQQSANAREIACWLQADRRVSRVNYPGLADLGAADAIFTRPERGGMISFEIADGDRAAVFRFLEALRLVVPATTLGDVYSLVLYPAISSHRAVPPEERARIGISDGLVRLSVGIEEVADIIADLDGALAAAGGDRRRPPDVSC
jgi:cystathionine gamma-synthase/methionine-gamma-lyase